VSLRPTVYRPQALWIDGQLVAGAALAVDLQGRVVAEVPPGAEEVPLPGKALLPGLVNGHSHAFQRALRGRTEYVETGHAADDFWSWREQMYRVAESLRPDEVFALSRQTFMEMALAGVTAVGEFHYLHHGPEGQRYEDPLELAKAVIAAAREVGLRICLLRVGYARAGFNVAPNPRQARFLDPSPHDFLDAALSLAEAMTADPLVSVGLAPHSIRAVPREWLEILAREQNGLAARGLAARATSVAEGNWSSARRGSVAPILHMHVSEQPGEIDACLAEHGKRPVAYLDSLGLLGSHFTAVHAVHLEAEEISALGRSGATVCACPSTERNLGDGIVPADLLTEAGVPLCLGSDSHAQIDLLDEARQLEGHLRLQKLRRAVLDPGTGSPDGLAARLLHSATRAGSASLGLPGGSLRPGEPADFFTVDLEHPSVAGTASLVAAGALGAIVFGAEKAAIRDVVVQGRWVVRAGRHPRQDEIVRAHVQVMRRLFA
jgi:formimidoylglutamate deiminase